MTKKYMVLYGRKISQFNSQSWCGEGEKATILPAPFRTFVMVHDMFLNE
jgi:hypothetical protein